jgi:NADH dehydrogenase/NADH:ubiquinone oxidoreductase subunit G
MARIKYTKKDREWAALVKMRYNNKCIVCGKKERLNAHHIIPRQNRRFKHDVRNGIALCPKHHRFSFDVSAHQNPFVFYQLLQVESPDIFKSVMEMLGGTKWNKS